MKILSTSFLFVLAISGTLQVQAQTPQLSSFPSAQAVIFLDFDGHTVAGTSWNFSGPIYCNSSGLDNAQITGVFNRVSEDYRPFDINITTDSTKFLAAPLNRRVRLIITTSNGWYGNAGGVAFLGSFAWGDDNPAFVFTVPLGYNAKSISEAASHEAGHTLNLQHQSTYNASCVKTSEYNYGAGAGEIGWAPIMGVGYYQNLTVWNNGKSTVHCDSLQSDLTIITTGNGFGFRPDDHADIFASATNASFTNNHFLIDGLIGQSGDQDLIRFQQPAFGRFQMTAAPYNVGTGNSGSNLDMQVSLYDAAQTLIRVYNPSNILSSLIDTNLSAGAYYLRVEGKGNIYAPDYAILGTYSVTGDFTANTLPLHRLELSGEVVGEQHKLNWIIEADEAIVRQELQLSTDGRHFSSLTASANDLRSFLYKPFVTTNAQYRLSVTFDNGRQYYSNIVQLKNSSITSWPKMAGNIASSNVNVSSPGDFHYSIFEMSGRLVMQGRLSNGLNNLNSASLQRGYYFIRFTNGFEQMTERFIRQ